MIWPDTHIAHSAYGNSSLNNVRARLRIFTAAETDLEIFGLRNLCLPRKPVSEHTTSAGEVFA
jgi:hypothetical protein